MLAAAQDSDLEDAAGGARERKPKKHRAKMIKQEGLSPSPFPAAQRWGLALDHRHRKDIRMHLLSMEVA